MKAKLTFLLVCAGIAAFAQGPKNALDKNFVEKTIEYYYTVQARKHGGNLTFYIERDSINMHAKTDYGLFKIQFLTPAEADIKLNQTNKDKAKLDRLVVKWVTLDTIDVVISGCTIGVKKIQTKVNQKNVTTTESFLTNCTENWVDVPTCRFVYDRSTTAWSQLNKGKVVK